MKKRSYYNNERTKQKLNDGSYVRENDRVLLEEKPGTVIGTSYDGVKVKFDDGSAIDYVEPYRLKKIAKHLDQIMIEFSRRALKS